MNFYIGEDALAHQRRTTALARFRAVQSGCLKDYIEYGAAMAELKHPTMVPAAPVRNSAVPAKTTVAPPMLEGGSFKTSQTAEKDEPTKAMQAGAKE